MDPVSTSTASIALLGSAISAIDSYRKFHPSSPFTAADKELSRIEQEFRIQEAVLRNTIEAICQAAQVPETSYTGIKGVTSSYDEDVEAAGIPRPSGGLSLGEAAIAAEFPDGISLEHRLNALDKGRLRDYLGPQYEGFLQTLVDVALSLAKAAANFKTIFEKLAIDPPQTQRSRDRKLLQKTRWAITQRRKTVDELERVTAQNRLLSETISLRTSIATREALQNIYLVRQGVDRITEEVEAFADVIALSEPAPDEDDADSVDTISIASEDKNKLSFVPISLWPEASAFSRQKPLHLEACLDSAATEYCISEALSKRLDLKPDTVEDREVETANGYKFFYNQEVKLTYKWAEEKKPEKRWFCVISNLFADVVLPNDFTMRKPEIFTFAIRRRASRIHVAAMGFPKTIGFSRRRRDQGKGDEADLEKAKKDNEERDAAAAAKRDAEMKAKYGIVPTSPSAAPTSSATSVKNAAGPSSTATPTMASIDPQDLLAQQSSTISTSPSTTSNTTSEAQAQLGLQPPP